MKELVEYISSVIGIKDKILLEKDILLHFILSKLTENDYFFDNFVFKENLSL